jgi:hypothetical protein
MAGGGNRVGALVVADRVGEQNLAALRDLDMAFGDGQRQLIVVLDLVGLEGDGRVLVLVSLAADGELREAWARAEQQRKARAGQGETRASAEPSFSRLRGTRHPPSSSWNGVARQSNREQHLGERCLLRERDIIRPRGEAASRCQKSCLPQRGSRPPEGSGSWPTGRERTRYPIRNRAKSRQRRR